MIAILISACLVSNPGVCREHRLPLTVENADQMHCMLHAPAHFAQWTEEHPGWRITRWRCLNGTSNDI